MHWSIISLFSSFKSANSVLVLFWIHRINRFSKHFPFHNFSINFVMWLQLIRCLRMDSIHLYCHFKNSSEYGGSGTLMACIWLMIHNIAYRIVSNVCNYILLLRIALLWSRFMAPIRLFKQFWNVEWAYTHIIIYYCFFRNFHLMSTLTHTQTHFAYIHMRIQSQPYETDDTWNIKIVWFLIIYLFS